MLRYKWPELASNGVSGALSCVPIHVSGVAGHEVGIQVLPVCSC